MRLNFLFATVCYLICTYSNAQTPAAFDIYHNELATKGEGVWVHQPYVFFVSDVACFKNKKYSGTKESKQASYNILKMIGEDLSCAALTSKISSKTLASAVAHKLALNSSQLSNRLSTSGALIKDRDIGNCLRRRVLALDYDQYQSAKSVLDSVNVDEVVQQVLSDEFRQKNLAFLSDYSKELGLARLSLASNKIIDNFSAPNIAYHKELAASFDDYQKHLTLVLNEIKKRAVISHSDTDNTFFAKHDTAKVIPDLIASHGFIKVDASSKQQKMVAKPFFEKGKINYDAGKLPERIIEDLSVSLRFDANQEPALNMLGSVAQALGKYELALTLHTRALVVSPFNAKTLIHVAKTYLSLGETSQAQKHVNFVLDHYQWLEPDNWANAQAKILSQEINNDL